MKSILTTVISGPDQPAIIRSLAHETRGIGGEWLVAKVIKLDGRFSAIARLTIESELENELKEKLQERFPECSFSYSEAPDEKQVPTTTVVLEIDCLDRPGITRDMNDYLSGLDIRVENLESTRHPIGAVTSTVYSTRVTLSAPRGVDGEAIAQKIEALSSDIKVKQI